MKRTGIILTALSLALVFQRCGGGSRENDLGSSVDSIMNKQGDSARVALSDEVVDQIIETFPSPLEMTSLLRNSGAKFSPSYLNNTESLDRFESNYEKAYNLGAFGADLGYANFYEETTTALTLLGAVRSLSGDLKVGQFFDFSTMKRLAENKNNLDSLLYISTKGFQDMDDYLTSNGRGEVSLLILFGGWLEGLYLTSEVCLATSQTPRELAERVGEQKIVIDDLIVLLTPYEHVSALAPLRQDLKELKALYDNVQITYTYAEPTTKEVNGMLVVEDNSKSEIHISDEVLLQILNKVKELRNKRVA